MLPRPVTQKGLTHEEAKRRLVQHGANIVPEKQQFSAVSIFIHQFTSPLVFVLLGAVGLTILLKDFVDAAVISSAVVVNTILGFIQEYKAETTLAALKKILTPQAKVIRDGVTVSIAAEELVTGDIVMLNPGDRVPADGSVMEAVHLYINEAVLTGESQPIEKQQTGKDGTINVFMGTVVASGRGMMEIKETGTATTIGALAQTLIQIKKEDTPLQKEVARLARGLAIMVLILCGLLFVLGMLYGEDVIVMLTTVVAIAVSAIPEGLAVSITVILAIGMQRVMKRNALVRRMVAAETLGSISTICVDKTGTITQGIMSVVKSDFTDTAAAMRSAVLANNLEDPLEIAIWDFTRTLNHGDPQKIVDATPRIAEVPFDSINKYMSVTTRDGTWVKGAPEIVMAMSDLSEKERNAWLQKVTLWGGGGTARLGTPP